jgi:hypothetical protein
VVACLIYVVDKKVLASNIIVDASFCSSLSTRTVLYVDSALLKRECTEQRWRRLNSHCLFFVLFTQPKLEWCFENIVMAMLYCL